MLPKELVRQAMAGQKPERTPVATFVTEVWAINRRGESLRDYIERPKALAEIVIQTALQDSSDIVFMLAGYTNLPLGALGAPLSFPKTGSVQAEEPLVHAPADLERLDLSRIDADPYCQTMWEAARLVQEAIGDRYMVAVNCRAPFTLAGGLRGVEGLLRDFYKNKAFVRQVLDFTTEVCWRYTRRFIEVGVEIIYLSDPSASGDMISRKHFADFVAPTLKKMVTNIKGAGAETLLHICGDITPHLDAIREIGPAILSFDYKVDLSLAKTKLGDRICLAGNVNPVGVLEFETPQEVARVASECVRTGGAGFILLPGCEAPIGVTDENLQAFRRAAVEND